MRKRSVVALAVIFAVIGIDQVVKFIVKTTMPLHEHIAVTPWFQIFFTENQGMAFGMDFVGTMALALFRAHYAAHYADATAPYPGIVEALDALRTRGAAMAVVSASAIMVLSASWASAPSATVSVSSKALMALWV